MDSMRKIERMAPASYWLMNTLIEVHRTTLITHINDSGIPVESWDEFLELSFADDGRFKEIDDPDSSFIWGDIEFRSDTPEAKLEYPVKLFGYDAIRLRSSGTTDEYHQRYFNEHSASLEMIDDINCPVKFIKFDLIKGSNVNGQRDSYPHEGIILVAPDMPPVALHRADTTYLEKNRNNTADLEDDSLQLIDIVTENFGEDAVETLSDINCQILINALITSPKNIVDADTV